MTTMTGGLVEIGFAPCYSVARLSFRRPGLLRQRKEATLLQWLRHAFAVETPGPVEPTPRQRELVERLCREVVRRRMTMPAQMMLETCRPLGYVGSQALVFFSPLITAIADSTAADDLAGFLEQRGSIDWLCQRLEELEEEATASNAEAAGKPGEND